MPPTITPTVGRIVYCFSTSWQGPRPAIITGVNPSGTINVNAWMEPGEPAMMRSELAGLTIGPAGSGQPMLDTQVWCEWMPYQQGQAAKTDDMTGRVSAALLLLAGHFGADFKEKIQNTLDGVQTS